MMFRLQVLVSISSMLKSELPGTYNKTRLRLVLKKKPNSLQSFSTDPESPEVNSAEKQVHSEWEIFQAISWKAFFMLNLDGECINAAFDTWKAWDGPSPVHRRRTIPFH